MKKIIYLILIFSNFLFCQNIDKAKVIEIQNTKDIAFNALKNFHNKFISEYYSIFITLDELRELGRSRNFNISKEKRNQLTSYPKFEYTNKIRTELNEILTNSEKLNLTLEKIVFYDFMYKKVETSSGIERYDCYLMFEEEGENDFYYGVEITLYNTDKGIRIVEIDDLIGAPKEKWSNKL